MCLLFYFGYHAVSGDRGLLQMMQWQQKVDTVRVESDAVRLERLQWEHRVSRMYDDSLDLDLLDEQARRELGLSHPDEIVIFDGNRE